MVDFDAPTQPIAWIRPRAAWYRRRGMWLAPVLLAVLALAGLVDAATAHDAPPITVAAPPLPMPTRVPTGPEQVTKAARLAYLAAARREVPRHVTDAALLQWAEAACGYLDRRPTPMGLLTVMSAVRNVSQIDGYRTAMVIGHAVQSICPRHSSLIRN